MKVIIANNLSKRYEFFRKEAGLWATIKALGFRQKYFVDAVSDVSFEIEEGEIVGFLGPNGAGKTTTLKMLSGILFPSSGHATVLSYDPRDRKKEYRKQFGIVMGQKNQMDRHLPPMDNFLMFKSFYEISDEVFERNCRELIDLLGIRDVLDIPVKKLSLGQRMKCELVASLLHNPKVLFLDEPTIGLDVVAQKNIRDFVKKYNQERKTTIILTSHYMDDIKELCERVIIINFGKIIYDGKLKDLISKYATDKIIRITTTEKVTRESLEKYGQVQTLEEISASILVSRDKVKAVAAEIIASDLPIDDILIDEMPIDNIIRVIFEEKRSVIDVVEDLIKTP